MDIRQLKYFVSVVQAKSFTAAADQMNISQPALGLQIRNLEDSSQVKLLERHSRGIVPTEAGQLLFDHAQVILRQVDMAHQALHNVGRVPTGKVTVGVTPTIARNLVSTIIVQCQAELPKVLLSMFEGLSRELARGVSESKFDICFTSSRHEGKVLDLTELFEEDQYFVGPANSPLAIKDDISLTEALSVPIFLPSQPHGLRTMVDAAAAAQGLVLDISLETNSTPMKRDMVAAGLGHAIMPYGAIRKEIEEGLVFARRIVNPGLSRRIYLGVRKEGPRSLAVDAVHNVIIKIATNPALAEAQKWRPLYGMQA